MKKVKYLLGFLVLGFGLLFSSQSFGLTTYLNVEGVTLPLLSSDLRSASYLYTFVNSTGWIEYESYSFPFLGYTLTYNGNTDSSYSPCKRTSSQGGVCPVYSFNNSVFGQDFYQSWTGKTSDSSWFFNWNQTRPGFGPIKLVLGQGNDFGNNFIYVGSVLNDSGVYTPHYMLGGGFMTSNYYVERTSPNINNYLRLFFDQNPNLSSPLDGLNLAENSGGNITGSIARQYFTSNGFTYQTKNQEYAKNFGDLGGSYIKGKHFGGYGMGYSYVIRTTNPVKWSDFTFVSVGSRCLQSAMNLGYTTFNNLSGCQVPGLLVLKGDSYVNFSNNASAIVLSKNPNNKQQILYEQFDCAEDDISRLFDSNYCNSIGHGYITINGNGNVLPASVSGNTGYNVTSEYSFLGFLLTGSLQGSVSINGSTYCLNNSDNSQSYCFGLTSTPNGTSIKEYYLNGQIGENTISSSDMINNSIISKCLNNPDYANNNIICSAYIDYFNGTYALGSGQYYQYSVNDSGDVVIEIIDQAGLFDGSQTVWVQDSSGNWVTNCTGGWCNPNPDNKSGSVFLSGDIVYYDGYPWIENVHGLLTGFVALTTGYFSFDNTGLFFKCPYPYDSIFTIAGWDLSIGNFDIAGPINCFISAFKHGKSLDFLDTSGLYDFGPLIKGTTKNHLILYHFFDFLLLIGLFLLYSLIYHRLK